MTIITLNFQNWSVYVNNRSTWGIAKHRIYLKGYIWTPFVKTKFQTFKEEK
jgi:hypothetical protein